MNDEQSKRLAEAADTIIQANESLEEAREAVHDRRFESENERERMTAGTQMMTRLDSAGKRVEDAIRKATMAAAACGRAQTYQRFRAASSDAKGGRALARSVPGVDGAINKRSRGEEALARLETALASAATIAFGEDEHPSAV
jgi:hypothetical protein